jgi:20S proteasome subunit alpha 1
VLITEKRVGDKLVDASTVTNIFNITPTIGCLTTGILPDAKCVVNNLRKEASDYQLENGHMIPIDILS